MPDLTTAREELMAVAIGQLGELLDRMDTLAPNLDASRMELLSTSTDLAKKSRPIQSAWMKSPRTRRFRR
ncbi:MAG: hypothetical protein ACK40L_09135 [Hydrogenophaga sp.]